MHSFTVIEKISPHTGNRTEEMPFSTTIASIVDGSAVWAVNTSFVFSKRILYISPREIVEETVDFISPIFMRMVSIPLATASSKSAYASV